MSWFSIASIALLIAFVLAFFAFIPGQADAAYVGSTTFLLVGVYSLWRCARNLGD